MSEAPCVVHLAREANGLEPLAEFLESYRRHEAGIDHRLILLFKGFAGPSAAQPHRDLADGLEFEELFVPDDGFDLGAYRRAAEKLHAGRYCFVNSHSRIRADGWLARLEEALAGEGVGLAGATGSWASLLSFAFMHLGLPSAYRSIFGPRRETLRQFDALQAAGADPVSPRRQLLNTAIALGPLIAGFRRFPAHHLRTNAFAIRHDLLLRVLSPSAMTKKAALGVESGRRSMTCEVERLGLKVVVVDRSGRRFLPQEWAGSGTFWQGEQEGLLVADNQTEQYRLGDPSLRLLLSRFAWGEQARPG